MTNTEPRRRVRGEAAVLTIGAFVGILFSFVTTVVAFSGLLAGPAKLTGADAQLGFPVQALSLSFFAVAAAVGTMRLADAQLVRWVEIGFLALSAAGVLFQLWTLIAGFSAVAIVLFALALLVLWLAFSQVRRPASEAQIAGSQRSLALGIALIIGGIAGWIGAFALTVDKVISIVNPDAALSCNISILVQCGKNLQSWQGSLLGFPNPLLGLGGFVAPIVVGVAILAGARLSRALWLSFNVGLVGAIALVIWLIGQSIFVLGTLCPWCMLVWAATIPMFWAVSLFNLQSGNIPVSSRARKFFAGAFSYVPFITVASYGVVLLLAQVQLDAIHHLG